MKNKNALITAAGVIIFLFAGMLTSLLSPPKEESTQEFSQPVESKKIISQDPAPVLQVPEVKIKNDWYVYVTGEVKNPGYYKISPDTRVFNAVEAAGGFTNKADETSINMAQFLTDGISINVEAKNNKKISRNNSVTIPGLASNPAPVAVNTQAVHTQTQTQNNNNLGLVDVNNATAKELEQLKGVGPAIAKRIIEYRNSHGKFLSPEDLIKVKGIGEAKLEKMRNQILIR